MLEVEPATKLITLYSGHADDHESGDARIKSDLDKLFNIDEAERTTLYEASLIRYFQPKFNKAFKDSFPSTNLKVLADCYDKDFSAIVAEICFDVLPFKLSSQAVPPKTYQIALHDLHSDESRRVFFMRK